MNNIIHKITKLVVCFACAHASVQAQTHIQNKSNRIFQPTPTQTEVAAKIGINQAELTMLFNKPLYKMKPKEVGRFIAYLHEAEPDLRTRVSILSRKNIGQPYEIFLLGEFPYELYDDQPLFNLERSDCVVFVEHTYAMALSHSWEDFFWMLQRIRYSNGVIGVTTRNHYTEADWNVQNAWLVSDISKQLAGSETATYTSIIDRTAFLKNTYKVDVKIAPQKITEPYIPKALVTNFLSQLNTGDFVNIISQKDGEYLASHVGLVVIGENGERHFLHSSASSVREEKFEDFISRLETRESRNKFLSKSGFQLMGFKFLRLNENPIVPPMAPQPRPGSMKDTGQTK